MIFKVGRDRRKKVREGQDRFQSKKVNDLNSVEALDMKDFLKRCDQTHSKKYQHVLDRLKALEY